MKRKPHQSSKGNQTKQNRPPVPPPPVEGNKDGESQDNHHCCHKVCKSTDKPLHWTKYAEAFCAIVLVLITGTYTYYAGGQLTALLESNEINRQSLQSVQRAFVWYKGHQEIALSQPNGDKVVQFQILFENAGNTEAVNVTHFVAVDLGGGEPTEDEFRWGGNHRSPTYAEHIAPRAPMTITPDGLILEKDLFVKDHTPFFWGWVAYKDIFPKTKTHITEFCETGKKVIRTPQGGYFIQSEMCSQHNCSDEYCKDYDQMASYVGGLHLQ